MRKVTMIIGVPAVGKSRAIQELLTHAAGAKFHHVKWTPYHQLHNGGIILGRYDELHKYPGTDRLSMAVQPHAIKLIADNPGTDFLFEGDRLSNTKTIDAIRALPETDFEVIHLTLHPDWLRQRRKIRRTDQSSSFWMSRNTKVNNIRRHCARVGLPVKAFESATPENTTALVHYLRMNRL